MSSPGLADPYETAERAAAVVAERSGVARHDVALVLGSGWRTAADHLGDTVATTDVTDVPGFRAPSVPGHAATLRSVAVTGTSAHVLVLGARTHLYEGHGVAAVAHAVRTAAATGVRQVVLTNGCGSLDPARGPGSVVLLSDHLNLTGATPLVGPRFVDMSHVYSPRLRELARTVDPTLTEGVYAQLAGPQYETPAEVRMAGVLGADLVGMSTALEAVAARERGIEVLGISLVTNLAAGVGAQPLSHDEVVAAGDAAAPRLGSLLAQVVRAMIA